MADDMSVEQKIDLLVEGLGSVVRKIDALDVRLLAIDGRLDGIDLRLDRMDQRLDGMDQKFSVQFDAVRADIRLVAEGVAVTNERLDRVVAEARDHHDKRYELLGQVIRHVRVRVTRLEGGRRRKIGPSLM